MNLNKVFLIGNLTRDPEVRALPSGQSVATFGVATNRVWKKQTGEKQQQTEFHNVVTFGRLSDIASQYLSKGKSVLIEGRIQTRSWQGQDGQKKYRTEIIVENMQLGPRGTGTGTTPSGEQSGKPHGETPPPTEELATVEYPTEEMNPDDIPF